METLRTLAEQQRNRRYFVKRGAINWTTFPFSKHPFAIAIMADNQTFLKQNGMNEANVTLEIFARMPDHAASRENPGIDDGLLDELIEDAVSILSQWRRSKDTSGESVLYKLNSEDANIVEAHDVSMLVQGVVATVTVAY